jgi:glycosyltransferase involved in cell wall biosynthesis
MKGIIVPGRVLFVSSITRYGGGERWMLDAAHGLARRNHAVVLVSRPHSVIHGKARRLGLDARTVEMRGDIDPIAILRIASILKTFRPDIVCANLDREIRICAGAIAMAGGASRLWKGSGRRAPRLIPRRGSEFPLKSKGHYRFVYTRFVDAVIVNSHATRETMLAAAAWFPRGKATVIYNGIDFSPFDALRRDRQEVRRSFRRSLGLPDDAALVVLVGELTERKGHRFVIEAAGDLLRSFPNVRFVFAGDGSARAELENMLAMSGSRSFFHLLGFRDDIPEILTASDVLVLPSSVEGFGYVLAEAMAASVPVVATRASSIPEVVEDGVTGYLHEYGKSGEIAALLAGLLGDPVLAQTMGEAGYRRARERFHIDTMLDSIEALFFTKNAAG